MVRLVDRENAELPSEVTANSPVSIFTERQTLVCLHYQHWLRFGKIEEAIAGTVGTYNNRNGGV